MMRMHTHELDNRRLTFGRDNRFQSELRRRVDEYFRRSGRRQRDCPQMYLKTGIILAIFAGLYFLLVFVAATWWQALPLAIMLGLSMAAIGFNIEHDGGHQAYSNHAWVNRLMAMTMDLIGASSYVWHWKHVVVHHTYTNLTGHDADIDLGFLGRLTPHQKRFRFHRWQHFYLWPLYGANIVKWHLYDDFRDVILGRIGSQRMPRPKRWELVSFISAKALFLIMAFAIPLLVHRLWVVFLFYGATVFVTGVVVSVVFQLAHCVEEAEFPLPREGSRSVENAWAIHQVETTVDFARGSRIESWLLGGLNFQIEHHLFPRVCHVNYPAISKLVEQTCREFGVRYREHRSFRAGLASHFRWLRRMGAPATPGLREKDPLTKKEASMHSPRVLYVEDDEDSREMLRMLLKLHSIETKAVGTAGEALSSIHAEHFDLYLLDAWLPDLDGFELCRRMRSYDSHTPILFFSGAGCEADKKMGHQAGANAYVIKPDVSCLLGSIARFIPRAKSAEG